MTRVTTIPGNFNTGVTLDDLLLKFPDLAVNIDASSITSSPSGTYPGEEAISSLIDVSTETVYDPKDLIGHFVDEVNGRKTAKWMDGQASIDRRVGYAMPNNFYTGKSAITILAVVKSRNALSGVSHQIFGGYYDNRATPMLALGFNSAGVLSLGARHSLSSETASSVAVTCGIDTWLPIIAVIEYAGKSLSLEIPGVGSAQAAAFAGTTGNSGSPSAAGCGFLGRHSASNSSGQEGYFNSWKKALKYDRALTENELAIARRSLKAIADKLNGN